MTQSPFSFRRSHHADTLNQLIELLRIPSISTTPEHRPDIDRAANWLAARNAGDWLRAGEVIPTRPPIAYGEMVESGTQRSTLLIYGHYDVQPTDPDNEWLSPLQPVVRDGNLYGRGTRRQGAALYIWPPSRPFLAPRSAPHQPQALRPKGKKKSAPQTRRICPATPGSLARSVLISDTGFLDARTPAIVYGVRWLLYMESKSRAQSDSIPHLWRRGPQPPSG